MSNSKSILRGIAAVALLCSLSACSAKVTQKAPLEFGAPQSVALLPTDLPSGVQREKVDAIRQAILAELRNSGYTVLDDSIVHRVCSASQCPESSELVSKYFVDGFFNLELGSVSRSNFLAGYVNAIRGTLALSDRDRRELIRVQKTESERGGLLFNTGQLLQGVLSQIRNSEERSFDRLADSFAQALVSKIPRPQGGSAEVEGSSVAISKVDLKHNPDGSDEVCTLATPQSMAFLLLNGRKANLREISPGKYCARIRLDDFPPASSELTVEVRSPYGSAARQRLASDLSACDLRGLVRVESTGATKRLVVACTRVKPGSDPIGDGCEDKVQTCIDHRFLIYQAQTPLGPFKKIGETRGVAWNLPRMEMPDSTVYQVVAVDPHGDFSVPERVAEKKGSSK